MVEQSQAPRLEPELPNGMEKVQARELERRSKLNVEELSRIEDEDILDKMVPPLQLGLLGEGEGTLSWRQRGDADLHFLLQLDRTMDFEERRLIRNAMRELRQRKRGTWGRQPLLGPGLWRRRCRWSQQGAGAGLPGCGEVGGCIGSSAASLALSG